MSTRDLETETAAGLLLRAAQRARPRPAFIAWRLARTQAQQGCSETQLAAELVLPLGQLPRLALCFEPSPRLLR